MPNRILLLFNPDPIEVPGMLPSHAQKNQNTGRHESMLDIARAVAKKAFWSEDDDDKEDHAWHDYLLKSMGKTETDSIDRRELFDVIRDLPEKLTGRSKIDPPCFAIIDMALYHYLRGVGQRRTRLEELQKLLKALWNRRCRPIYLVSTIRAPQRDDNSLKFLRPYYDGSIQLLRSDSNIWDALYNLVKRGEHKVRLREVMDGERTEYKLKGDLGEERCALKPKQVALKIEPIDITNPLIIEDQILNVLSITPNDIAHREQLPETENECTFEEWKSRCDHRKNQVCTQPVIVRNCKINRLEFSSVCFERPVIFDNTRITGTSHIRFCEFKSVLHFHTCRFDDDVDLELSHFRFRMPWFHKCYILLRLTFRRNITPDAYAMHAAPTLMFSRTIFEANNRIDMPKQRARLIFYSCNFHSGEYTEINWLRFRNDVTPPVRNREDPQAQGKELTDAMEESLSIDTEQEEMLDWKYGLRRFLDRRHKCGESNDLTPDLDIYVRMVNCDISGRVVFRENPHYTRFYHDASESSMMGLMLSLEGSAVNGTVDVSEVRVRWLDVMRANFQSGGIVMNRMQCRPIQESMRLASIIWDVIPVVTGVFVVVALLWNFISTLPGWIVIVGLLVFAVFPLSWSYLGDWRRRVRWIVTELEKEGSRQKTGLYDTLTDRSPRIRSIMKGVRRVFRVRAEYSGLVQHELILDNNEDGKTDQSEQWRFGDAARIRAQLVEPQKEIPAELPLNPEVHNERTRRHYYQEVFSSVAQQYEDLTHAFANAPVTDELEDLCHYKSLKYRNEATGMSVPLKTQYWVRMLTIIYALITVVCAYFSFKLSGWCQELVWEPGAAWGVITCGYVLIFYLNWEYRTALMHLFKRLMLERILAYGVYPSRAFMSAVVLILLYAVSYTILPVIPDAGRIEGGEAQIADAKIHKGEFNGETDENPKRKITGEFQITPKPEASGFPSMLYFSIVTFTTLGYGDMHPTGFLRIVAGSEALVGAIMIAMITVSLARQFLRR